MLTKAPANFNELVKAAKAEGELTVIACPHDWVNYGEIFTKFSAKYGIKLNELNPDGSSGEEIEAIKANKNNKGRQAPDVLDVGLSFGPQMEAEKLVAPYMVKTWKSIPDNVKDKDGYWYGDYYGALAFEVNTDLVKNPPKDWADLLKPEYKGKVALAGDPRTSNQAFLTVAAAALANGGSFSNIMPGLKFFKKMNEVGNFVPIIAVPGTVASGETPITVRWDYNALSNRDKSAGNPNIGVIIPATGVVAGVYIQAHQRLRPAPQCGPAVHGIPLLRRRPAALAQGLRPPGPVQRPGQAQRDPGRPGRQAAARLRLRQGHVPQHRGPGSHQEGRPPRTGTRSSTSTLPKSR